MSAQILIPDFVANAVNHGYRYSEVRAKSYDLADYRRALTVPPDEITLHDVAYSQFHDIYTRRLAGADKRIVYPGIDDL